MKDKQRAIQLLDETFNYDFNTDRFSRFIKELFNEFNITQRERHAWSEFKSHIDTYQFLGSYTDNSKKSIDVLAVKLKSTSSIDRARTKQRNFVARYLGNNNKDAALVAFYGDNKQDWRFSFVKLDYHLEGDESGKVKPVEDLTPAKRYSYLVGVNEPNHTCRRQFLDLIIKEDTNPSIAEIEDAFSIDNVTKEFFSDYKELFSQLKESLARIIEKHPNVKEEFDKKSISTVDFSKKLLGQIVFIYFLQKKGWLGVGKDKDTSKFKEWGEGPKKFLRKLFDKEIIGYDKFFNEILEPLFYEALSKEYDHNFYSRFDCKIPFLNGGLFEPINDYDWVNVKIPFENKIFEDILETFDRFNFTVKEDEPLDKEVAVDPEMLGKVFENLLDVTDRKSKGAFYTPREIVHYMCQQSLINYLETNTDVPVGDIETFIQHGELAQQITSRADVDEKYIPASIKKNRDEIENLLKNIKIVDPAVGSGAFPMGMMNEIVKARSILSYLRKDVKNNYDLKRETIENCLYGVDIDSSAVDIAKLRFWLSLVVDETDIKKIKPLPNLDHRIMCGNSLLEEFEGIKLFDEKLLEVIPETSDFELELVNAKIEKLYAELGEIHTGKRKDNGRKKEIEIELKKLDRKKKAILSRPKDETQQSTFDSMLENRRKESQKKLVELKRLQTAFFNEQGRKRKKELAGDIDRIEWELIEETLKEQGNEDAMQKLAQYKKNKSKPFFLWKLYFSKVFQRDNPGFDVVIANPPYVQIQKFSGKQEQKDWENENYKTYNRTGDIYCLFYEKGNLLLRKHGVLTFISSNKWMRANYGKLLRRYLVNNVNPSMLIDFGGYKVFDTATVDTCILIYEKEHYSNNTVACAVKNDFNASSSIDKYVRKNSIILDNLSEDNWIIVSKYEHKIKEKLEKIGTPLKDWDISIYYGIKTGLNEAFIVDGKKKNELVAQDPKNAEILKPILRGRDIKKYKAKFADLWLIFIPWHFPLNNDSTILGDSRKAEAEFQIQYSSVYEHLLKYKTKLSARNKAETGIRYEWYALQRCAASYYPEFEKEKIVYPNMTQTPSFAYSNKHEFCNDKSFILTSNNNGIIKYMAAVLNSKSTNFQLRLICSGLGLKGLEVRKVFIENLPIPKVSPKEQEPFIELADTIIAKKERGDDTTTEEKQIDQLVYKLYDLTPEEIQIVEGFNEGK